MMHLQKQSELHSRTTLETAAAQRNAKFLDFRWVESRLSVVNWEVL
jgi:hypothetical protein